MSGVKRRAPITMKTNSNRIIYQSIFAKMWSDISVFCAVSGRVIDGRTRKGSNLDFLKTTMLINNSH